jgi:hypothetical protein
MMKETIFAAVVLVLSACAAGTTRNNYGPIYTYNEVLIINNSQELIRNVTIRSGGTGSVFSCDNIAALGVCSNRFGRRPYTSAPFSVEWVFGDSTRKTHEVGIKVPAYNSPSVPLRAVLEVSPQGEISAYFEQNSQGK